MKSIFYTVISLMLVNSLTACNHESSINESTEKELVKSEEKTVEVPIQPKNGFGKLLSSKGDLIYEGEFKNGLYDGEGKLFSSGKITYEGHFQNGKKNGYGKLYVWFDGSIAYEGGFKDDLYHGQGILYDKNSFTYKGEFKDGKPSGHVVVYNGENTQGEVLYEGDLDGWYSGDKPLFSGTTETDTKSEGVRIGMTQEEVLNSSWGKPQDVNRTITQYGTKEQWVYGGGNYLYFEDGILTAIQN